MLNSQQLRSSLFLIIQLGIVCTVICEIRPTKEELIPPNRRIIEHKSTSTCLNVQDNGEPEDFKLILENCNWEKGRAELEGVFSVITSNSGGKLLRWTNGPKPKGFERCLSTLEDNPEDEDNNVYLSNCDPKSNLQNWFFDLVSEDSQGEYLIQKNGEDKCLVVTSDDSTAQIVSCNKEDSDQVWRICENLVEPQKCNPDLAKSLNETIIKLSLVSQSSHG